MRRSPSWTVLLLLTAFTLVASALPAPAFAQAEPKIPFLIGFASRPGPADEALVRRMGGDIHYTYHLVPAIAASLPQRAIDGLRRNPRVTHIEPDGEFTVADAELDGTWGVKRIGSGAIHTGGNTGAGVKVAVLDSGIDYTHPDLSASYAGGYDFVNKDNDPRDDHGHGTHVAGTIAAAKNGTGVVGVAPDVRLYAVKVLGADGRGSFSNIIAGLQWAVDNGIQITNNSYGSKTNPGTTVQAAFDNAYAVGLLHVAAAGNSGTCAGTSSNVGYPAAYASVIAVAATDSNDARACFSSTGTAVELAAPGVNIKSTVIGGGYESWSGTSMASPHVAGAAALVLACGCLTDENASGGVNNVDLRLRLQQTAQDLGAAGRDTWYGFGLVRADLAAAAGGAPPPPPANQTPVVTITSPSNGASFVSGATISFSGSASDAEDGALTSQLAWTSSIDGAIGTGGAFSRTLSAGAHTITASATDSGGATGAASVTVTVAVNQTPAVSITSPSNNASFASGATVSFQGTASDAEDGSLTAALVWTSNLQGLIGTGGSFSRTLNPGAHTITASATDSGGATGAASVTITVAEPAPPAADLSVVVTTNKTTYTNGEWVVITVTVTDGTNPVDGAAVHIEITTASGNKYPGDVTTNSTGVAQFSFKPNTKKGKNSDGAGTYSVTATATKSGYNAGSGSASFVVN